MAFLSPALSPSLSRGSGLSMRHFLQLALSQSICAGKPSPEIKPAVVEIGRERGSAEAASQPADAALSWNTLEGGVLDSLRRLGTDRVAVRLHLKANSVSS